LITRPPSRRCGKQARRNQYDASGPVSKESSTCSSVSVSSGPMAVAMALLTRMSTVPNRSTTAATNASTFADERMSHSAAYASAPASAREATVPEASRTSATAIRAPSLPRAIAIPRPTPRAAPVTIATLPSSTPMARG
jgi:hypothetical protein